MTNPWQRPEVAQQQRALNDRQLTEKPMPAHFLALAEAVRSTQCPGQVLIVGCGVGHEREILDRAGVEYRAVAGIDISGPAIALARERYPESQWREDDLMTVVETDSSKADVVVDSACLMHVETWREHLAALCRTSRRHVILHRVPLYPTPGTTSRTETYGYGQMFPAWRFAGGELVDEMKSHGFVPQMSYQVDDPQARTLTFAKPRHWVSYCDSAYLPRLKALHASMVRHCGPFELHVLAWDEGVAEWCRGAGVDHASIHEFLRDHADLEAINLPGPARTRIEHMWTCGPQWIADAMFRAGEPVTYVDADLLFFSSPEPMFAEIGGAPAAVVPHGFAEASRGLPGPTRESHLVFGEMNCGLVHVADPEFASAWAEQVRIWCFDRVESRDFEWPTKHPNTVSNTAFRGIPSYGDQGYLSAWKHQGAHVIQHPGACAGPWQVHTRAIDVRDGVIHFGNRPLIAYHFSGYREGPHGAESLSRPEYQISERQAELIYRPYVAALQEAKNK